jgi:hypothetical protein
LNEITYKGGVRESGGTKRVFGLAERLERSSGEFAFFFWLFEYGTHLLVHKNVPYS